MAVIEFIDRDPEAKGLDSGPDQNADEDEELAQVFVVVLTARGQKADEMRALEVGADLYMSKPFDDEVVLDVIRDVFDGRRSAGDSKGAG